MSAKISPANIMLKRAYERPDTHDGVRILVDRLWPRGVTKQAAAIDQWFKEIAPTAELRKWFGHEAQRWPEFQRRYAQELTKHEPLLETLREHARRGPLTLVYSAHDELHNDAIVLRNVLLGN